MISHRQIMINLAQAIAADQEVAEKAKELFHKPVSVIVWGYGGDLPTIKDAPFVWLFSEPVENEDVGADQTFSVGMVIAAALQGERGEKKITKTLKARTETENGLIINGSAACEDFRDFLAGRIRGAYKVGANLSRIRRQEDDLSHFPLSWAEMFVEFEDYETL